MIHGTVFGRVVSDPQTFNWGENRTGVRFQLASDSTQAWREENSNSTFLGAVVFYNNSYLEKNLYKGRLVYLTGEITQENRDPQGNLYPMNITVDQIQFGPEPRNRQQQGGYGSTTPNENFNGGVSQESPFNGGTADETFPDDGGEPQGAW